jgi:NADH-quinone oxidoreductase subunit F
MPAPSCMAFPAAKRTGVWELPIGTTGVNSGSSCRRHAGRPGLKCWLPGGASTDFLLPEHLDLAMDYDTIMKAGSRMGTGLIMVVDDKQNMVSVVRNLEEFFARESCGWCTPCRDGLPWGVKILRPWSVAKAQAGDIEPEQLTRDSLDRQDLLCPCPWRHGTAA